MNMRHVNYNYVGTAPLERNLCGKLVDNEFKVCGWSKIFQGAGSMHPITLVNAVTKLKQSLLEGAVVTQMRDIIAYNESIVYGFLFAQSLDILYILHMENRVNAKIIMMLICEGMRKRSEPVALVNYFERLVVLFNNGVMHDRDGQWKLPMKDWKIEAMFLSNRSAHNVVKNVELLFDLVFERHPSECQHRNLSKDCITEKLRLSWRVLDKGLNSLMMKFLAYKERWIYFMLRGMNYVVRVA